MPSLFTVQDTRACDAPRVPIGDAGLPVLRHLDAPSAVATAHAAASTGVPAWCPPPRAESVSTLNCRIVAIAEEADPSLSRDAILKRSATTRTGIMPVRLGFADRVAAVILLVNTAFHRQYSLYREAQTTMRAAVPVELLGPDVAESLLVPEDMADFDFVLQWRELRDEVTSSLRRHYEAATRAFAAVQGTQEHHEASVAAQRTSPEVLVQALSGMTIFDPIKWGAFALPYDDKELKDALEAAARTGHEQGQAAPPPGIAVSPPPPQWDVDHHHVDPYAIPATGTTTTASTLAHAAARGGPPPPCPMTANLGGLDNGSFIPSPGASSRPGSPSEGGGSFGAAPVDYCAPASADITPAPTPTTTHVANAATTTALGRVGVADADAAAVAAAAAARAVASFVLPGTAPSASCAAAAAVNRIERPERAVSLVDCLDPDAIAERQQAAAGYRLEVLRACGLVGACQV